MTDRVPSLLLFAAIACGSLACSEEPNEGAAGAYAGAMSSAAGVGTAAMGGTTSGGAGGVSGATAGTGAGGAAGVPVAGQSAGSAGMTPQMDASTTDDASTTGGAAGDTVTAHDATELQEYAAADEPLVIEITGTIVVPRLQVSSNKTLRGVGASATIEGGIRIRGEDVDSRVQNVIVQNLS